MSKKQPKYVSLEPDAFLSDLDFQAMTAEQRGVYFTLILYLYCNNGQIEYDEYKLRNLCNISSEFDFESVLYKFRIIPKSTLAKTRKIANESRYITHKRVTQELRRAQVYINRGVKAAKTRWSKQCSNNAQAMQAQCDVTKRNVKESKVINNTKTNTNRKEQCGQDQRDSVNSRALSLSASVRFADQLDKTLKPANKSDRKSLLNICQWLMLQIKDGRFDEDGVYIKVLDIAKESHNGRNRMALFFSRLDEELDYRPRAEKEKQLAQASDANR